MGGVSLPLDLDLQQAFNSVRGLRTTIQSELDGLNLDFDVSNRSSQELEQIVGSLRDIGDTRFDPLIGRFEQLQQRTRAVETDAGRLRQALDQVGNQTIAPRFNLAELDELRNGLRAIDGASPEVRARFDASEIRDAEQVLGRINSSNPAIRANVDDSEVQELRDLIARIEAERIELDVDTGPGAAGRLDGFFSARAAGFGAAVTTAVAGGVLDGLNREDVQAALIAGLGSAELREAAQAATQSLFEDGFGDRADISGAVSATARSIDSLGLSLDDLERFAATGLNIEQTFGVDAAEAVNGAAQQVRTGLAPSLDEAFANIIEGYQNTDIRARDQIDVLNEFATSYRALGLDAQDFFTLNETGLDAGARNVDRIADAFSEFAIKVPDDLQGVRDALDILDLEGIQEDVAAGGPRAREAVSDVLEAIRELDNAQDRENVIRELFGSPGEDLTAEIITSLRLADEELNRNAEGTIDTFNDTLNTRQRRLTGALNEARDDFSALVTGNFGDDSPLRTSLDDITVTINPEFEAQQAAEAATDLDAELGRTRDAALDLEVGLNNAFGTAAQFRNIRFELDFFDGADAEQQREEFEEALARPIDIPLTIAQQQSRDELFADVSSLAADFSADLNSELSALETEIFVSLTIDETNGVDDIQDAVNAQADATNAIIERSQAAAIAIAGGFTEVGLAIEEGRLGEGAFDEIIAGGDLTNLEAEFARAREVAEAAGADAAEAQRLGFEESVLTGESVLSEGDLVAQFGISPDEFEQIGREIGQQFVDGLALGLDDGRIEEAGNEIAARLESSVSVPLGIRSPSLLGIEIGEFFDEGIAIGIGSGLSAEAAEQLAEQVAGIEINLSGIFNVDAEQFDERGPFEQVLDNIRAASAEAQAEVDLIASRASAAERLAQFGEFEQLTEAVLSGQADQILSQITNAPNVAVFNQLENEIAGARGVTLDDLVDTDQLNSDAEFAGGEYVNFLTQGAQRSLDEANRNGGILAEDADRQLAELRLRWGIFSPSTVMQEIGLNLDQGLALGINSGFTAAALEQLQTDVAERELAVLSLEGNEDLADELADFWVDFYGELSPEVGETFADGFAETDFAGVSSAIVGSVESADAGGVLSAAVRDADLQALLGLDIDDAPLSALTAGAYQIDLGTSVDTAEIEDVLEDNYNITINANVDVDDSQVNAIPRDIPIDGTVTMAIDPDTDEIVVQQVLGSGGTIILRDKGGYALHPELTMIAEAGNPEAVIGPHHDPADALSWLRAIDAYEPIAREVIAQESRVMPAGSVAVQPAPDRVLVAELAAMQSRLAATNDALAKANGQLASIASSSLKMRGNTGQAVAELGALIDAVEKPQKTRPGSVRGRALR